MQSSNSSDALLMNIFCYPKFWQWQGPRKLLDVAGSGKMEFGWEPDLENETKPTEIDLKFDNVIIEAKLTEDSFYKKKKTVVEKYKDLALVFDTSRLILNNKNEYENYQLIRNFLTAYKYDCKFILLVDEARTDLIKSFFDTVMAVKDYYFAKRLKFITWQELVATTGGELKPFITRKYF
jgi:hypothetical protein